MNVSLSFIRIVFTLMSILFLTFYSTSVLTGGFIFSNVLAGLTAGLLFSFFLIGIDNFFKNFNLRALNIALLGLFFGYLMGQALLLVIHTGLAVTHLKVAPATLSFTHVIVYLVTAYLGMIMTVRASEEIHLSIPFVKFKSTSQKKKDVIIDSSILMDSRIIDLASSGLLDNHLLLPRFILKELYESIESVDESAKFKARRCLDVFKKLENIPTLNLRYVDTDFPEIKDPMSKLIRLARLLDTNIITADINRIQQSSIEGVRIVNIHMLSNALKPLTQTGEYINIKVQRYGKEPRQGVGYLEDGTMVVVNGGAESIGETIKAQVLSVKHTSSGRMIFCNSTTEELLTDQESAQSVAELEIAESSYFSN